MAQRAVEEAHRLRPDVIVLNITMPTMDGLEAARRINESLPESAIVILSSHTDKHFIEAAKAARARAYVAKTNAGEALLKAIDAALKSDDFVLMD
ncbi:MAG: response regulator [Candidatus Acidiferrales bacterium]